MKAAKLILGIPLLLLILVGAIASFIHMGLGAGYAWGLARLEEISGDGDD
jgi:hypothetical protein